jgi:hypothetical protein
MQTCKWIKWCRTYSHGLDSTWEYMQFYIGDTLESIEQFICEYYLEDEKHDDHFRGIRIEEIDHPPKEWFDEKIKELDAKILSTTSLRNEYDDWRYTIAMEELLL